MPPVAGLRKRRERSKLPKRSMDPAHNGCEFRWSLQRFGELG